MKKIFQTILYKSIYVIAYVVSLLPILSVTYNFKF